MLAKCLKRRRRQLSWVVTEYVRHGQINEALKLCQRMMMEEEGLGRNIRTLISILGVCSSPQSLTLGKLVYTFLLNNGLMPLAATAVVTMFVKCGAVGDARRVFDETRTPDLVSWNAMIAGYARNSYGEEAFKLFREMQEAGVQPDNVTFISILNACATPEDLPLAKLVHSHVITTPIKSDVVLANALVTVYMKCGTISDARNVFDRMPVRDVVSWTAMIAAYAKHGRSKEAFRIFRQMQEDGVKPNEITFISILNACSTPEALELGKVFHACILKSGTGSDVVVGNSLLTMYSRCGSIEDARGVFDNMIKRDLVSWTVLIAGYARYGHYATATIFFQKMQLEGLKPGRSTLISILNACTTPEALALGQLVHSYTVKSGIKLDMVVGNALITMYSKCRSLWNACRVFNEMPKRDVVSWTAMIGGYALHGNNQEAFDSFWQMQLEDVKPNRITFISILDTCASPDCLALGKLLHANILESDIEPDAVVTNALITMYGKCGSIEDARRIFDEMRKRNVVSWSTMIAGYAQHGCGEEALRLFRQMQKEGAKPNRITFISILDVCASLAALELGKLVHCYIVESAIELNVVLGNALINMYGRCGSIEDARVVFDKIPERDVASWTAMISAYGQQGHGKDALQLFQQMQREGIYPDAIAMVCLLYACSHAGMVDEGFYYFNSMSQDFNITPKIEHYNSMVDLLGRAGQLDEAEDFINRMPFQPNDVTWMTLLSACRNRGCIDRGKHAAERALQCNPQSTAAYVVLSNIYIGAGMWGNVASMRNVMANRALKEETGYSWIEIGNEVHTFSILDRSHPQTKEIYDELERLIEEMKAVGYVPDNKLMLHDVEEEQKEHLLYYHSEKLAITFGLISTPSQTPLRIIKNLRMCSDCHTASKLISRIVGREIIMRESNHFHHIKNGMCSCGDYW